MSLLNTYYLNGYKITEEMIEAVKASEFYQKYGKALYVGPEENVKNSVEVITIDYDRSVNKFAADLAEDEFLKNELFAVITTDMLAAIGAGCPEKLLVHKKEIVL